MPPVNSPQRVREDCEGVGVGDGNKPATKYAIQARVGLLWCAGHAAVHDRSAAGGVPAGGLCGCGGLWPVARLRQPDAGGHARLRWYHRPHHRFLVRSIARPLGAAQTLLSVGYADIPGRPLVAVGAAVRLRPHILLRHGVQLGLPLSIGHPGVALRWRHHQRRALQRLGRRTFAGLQRAYADHELARRLHCGGLPDRRLHPGDHLLFRLHQADRRGVLPVAGHSRADADSGHQHARLCAGTQGGGKPAPSGCRCGRVFAPFGRMPRTGGC